MTPLYLSVAWMAGIYLASRIALPVAMWGLVSLLPLSVVWLWRREPRVRLAALCVLFAVLGGLRYSAALARPGEDDVSAYNDQGRVAVVGVGSLGEDPTGGGMARLDGGVRPVPDQAFTALESREPHRTGAELASIY